MKTIIIIGKQCSGKKTLANYVAHSLGHQLVSKVAKTDENDLFGISERYCYTQTESLVENAETETSKVVLSVEKVCLGEYGFEKTAFADENYVITAGISELEDIFSYLGRENCMLICIDIPNSLERRRRAVGKGDFQDLAFWRRDMDEKSAFSHILSDLVIDNKDVDTSKILSSIRTYIQKQKENT